MGPTTPTRVARALKGRELRREAARLLWGWSGSEAIHYREWFERVLAAGYAIGGKDPAASFLTNVRDSPAVVGAEGQGLYRLDPSSVDRVDQDIVEVEAELADAERRVARAYEQGGEGARRRREREEIKQRLRKLLADRDELGYVFAREVVGEAPDTAPAHVLHAA